MQRRAFLAASLSPSLAAQSGRVVQKIIGEGHKLVLFTDGSVGGWGDMRDGQLGPRAAIPNVSGHSTAFVPINLGGRRAIDVAATLRASLILLDDGTVLSMGWGSEGALGTGEGGLNGSERPIPHSRLRGVASISGSRGSFFAVHRDGTVSAWGTRDSGVLGDGLGSRYVAQPTPIPGVSGVTQISAHTVVLALLSSGKVLSWGQCYLNPAIGRPDLDPDLSRALPGEIPGLSDVSSVLSTGVSAALKRDGSVWVWGLNTQAQFGNGRRSDNDKSYAPLRVPNLASASAIAGGTFGRHFLALLKDGTLRSWGNSDWGQTGTGISGREQSNVLAPRLHSVTRIFAGGNNSFAIRSDGSAWIWGSREYQSPLAWPLSSNSATPIPLVLPA